MTDFAIYLVIFLVGFAAGINWSDRKVNYSSKTLGEAIESYQLALEERLAMLKLAEKLCLKLGEKVPEDILNQIDLAEQRIKDFEDG